MPCNAAWTGANPVIPAIAQSQASTGAPRALAPASASVDFPVPGGPVTSSRVGRSATG